MVTGLLFNQEVKVGTKRVGMISHGTTTVDSRVKAFRGRWFYERRTHLTQHLQVVKCIKCIITQDDSSRKKLSDVDQR